MSIKPLHDRVVVKPIEADEISAGGIVIPTRLRKSPPGVRSWPSARDRWTTATCARVAEGRRQGHLRPVRRQLVQERRRQYKVLREDDVLAVIG